MPEYFLHGVEVIEVDDGIRPIRSVRSSVIGLIGTAPDAEPAVAASATTGAADDNTGLTLTAKTAGLAGNAIRLVVTKPDKANARLNVTVKARTAITVTLATGGDKAATTTAAELKAAIEGKASSHALVAVAHTGDSDGSGVVAVGDVRLAGGADAPFMADVPALVAGPRAAARLGDAGTLKAAYEALYAQGAREAIVVRVEEGNDDATTLANVVGQAAQGTGVFALLAAASKLDLTPRILVSARLRQDRNGPGRPGACQPDRRCRKAARRGDRRRARHQRDRRQAGAPQLRLRPGLHRRSGRLHLRPADRNLCQTGRPVPTSPGSLRSVTSRRASGGRRRTRSSTASPAPRGRSTSTSEPERKVFERYQWFVIQRL